MNNFYALNFERSSLDHGVWFMVVGFEMRKKGKAIFDPKIYK